MSKISVKHLFAYLSLIGIIVCFQNCGQFKSDSSLHNESGSSIIVSNPVIIFDEIPDFYTSQNLTLPLEIQADRTDSVVAVTCQVGGGTRVACDESRIDLSALADGNHSISVTVITERGLTATKQVVVRKDTIAPTITVSSAPALVTNSVNASFAYMASDNSSGVNQTVCSINNQVLQNCGSPANLMNLRAGQNRFQLQVFDLAGNASQIYSYTWTVDTSAPTVTIVSPPSAFINTTTVSISFTGSLVAGFQCQLGSGEYIACTSPVVYNNLTANTSHTVRVRGVNAAGTFSSPATVSWAIDNTAPTQPTLTSNVSAVTELTAAQFVFSSTDNLSGLNRYECSLDGSAYATCVSSRNLSGLAVGNHTFSVRSVDNAANVSVVRTFSWQINVPAPSGTLSPAMTLEYVDEQGVRQLVQVVNGQTTVSGVAPFLVKMDASSTRAPTAFQAQTAIPDPEAYAFLMVGYRLNYGENRGGVWPYPQGASLSRDEDTGPPIFSHVYRNPGSYSVRMRTRDTLGNEATVQFNIVVNSPPSPTLIRSSDGRWPNFVSGRRYALEANGDYRSFGSLETGGLHNIVFEKTGTGADPIISTFSPDGRSKFSATRQFEFRAAHIRLVNIDVGHFMEGQRGFDYVGVIGGIVRRYTDGGHSNLWHEGNDIVRSNVRYSHGLFLQDTEVRSTAAGYGYVIIGTFNGLHAKNTRFVHTENGPTTYRMLRIYGANSTFRNNLWFSQVDGGAANGLTIGLYGIRGQGPIRWRTDDTVGPITATSNNQSYGYLSEKSILQNNQMYAAGSFLTNGTVAMGGGNFEDGLLIFPRLVGMEDNVYFPTNMISQLGELANSGGMSGQYAFWRNNRKDMGRGSYISANTDPPNRSAGDLTTFNGPYFIETQNTRPVPSNF